ncbi:serine/threonine-protein phosphatase, partial [Micromonospora sp. M51]|nr:serine/threonine-protein phosphatase [Micromonospora sp. M51]
MSVVPTRLLQSGRRPLSPGSRAGLGAALVLLAIVSAVEVADGREVHYVALLAAAPVLAAALASWLVVLGVGVAATLFSVGFALVAPKVSLDTSVNVVAVALVTALAVAVAWVRQRQAERIVELTKLASVAQQAVLRPLGPQVGTLSVAG